MASQSVSPSASLVWKRLMVNTKGSFYRAAIPKDITSGAPNPSEWGTPSAALLASQCEIGKFFANHSIIFGKMPFFIYLYTAIDY